MADIGLREQIAASPDLSFGPDTAEFDIWLREQFPEYLLSFYETQLGIQSPVLGVAQPLARPLVVRLIAPLLHF